MFNNCGILYTDHFVFSQTGPHKFFGQSSFLFNKAAKKALGSLIVSGIYIIIEVKNLTMTESTQLNPFLESWWQVQIGRKR